MVGRLIFVRNKRWCTLALGRHRLEERRLADKESLRKWPGGMSESAPRLSWGLVLNAPVHRQMAEF